MRSIFFPAALLFVACLRAADAAPTNNPLATYHTLEEGMPSWTERIQWDNVIDMSAYAQGETEFERFENARDRLHSEGGGVLYYPAGTYTFSGENFDGPTGRGLMLKSGVVIRGQAPGGNGDLTDGTSELPTKFVFSFDTRDGGQVPRHWNFVGITTGSGEQFTEVDNVGLVWVQMDGATVYFGPQMEWGDTYATAEGWKSGKVLPAWQGRVPDGTHPCDPFCGAALGSSRYLGAGDGRIVFGCRLDNAVVLNDMIDEGFGEGGYHSFKYGGRIQVYGSRVFIANNAITKPTRCFLHEQTTSEGLRDIVFDYAFAVGIDVNKDFSNVNSNKHAADGGYWHEGIVVRDNLVYNHGMKGLNISGTWVTLRDNTNLHDYNNPGAAIYGFDTGWTLTGDGYKTHADVGAHDAFQSRALDLAGKALWIHGNYFEKIGTAYPANDGEGILCQAHGGTQLYSWAITRNRGVNCQGTGQGYMGGYDVGHYGCLTAWNRTPSKVGSVNNKRSGLWDCAFVADTVPTISTSAADGQPSDVIIECPEGSPAAPTGVTVHTEGDHVNIAWTDASDNEIGFRVDRRTEEGNWTTIAYRPRHSQGTEHNVQAWVDYLAPPGYALHYRVTAVGCDDNGGEATAGPVSIGPVMAHRQSRAPRAAQLPHPMALYDLQGRLLGRSSSHTEGIATIRAVRSAAGIMLVRRATGTSMRIVAQGGPR